MREILQSSEFIYLCIVLGISVGIVRIVAKIFFPRFYEDLQGHAHESINIAGLFVMLVAFIVGILLELFIRLVELWTG